MKHSEIEKHIGERVTINGYGDLAFEFEVKPLIYDRDNNFDIRILRLTKGGLVQLQVDGKVFHTCVPSKNVDLFRDGQW